MRETGVPEASPSATIEGVRAPLVTAAAAAAAATAAAAEPATPLAFEPAGTANDESCLSTFAAPQLGACHDLLAQRTSSSKWSSHSMHAYS